MRRQSRDELADAARRRLELIRQELVLSGVSPAEPEAEVEAEGFESEALPAAAEPLALMPVGRHRRRGSQPSLGRGARAGGWLTDRLPPTLQGRVRLGMAELALVALVLGVGLAVAAFVVLRSGSSSAAVEQESRPVSEHIGHPARPLVTAAAGEVAAAPSDTSGVSGATPIAAGGPVVVDVTGKVRHPGVVRLPSGARVVDAIRRAGGARRGVDLSSLNLARVLTDGEQIVVGAPPGAAPSAPAAAAGSAQGGGAGPTVNLNTASLDQLEGLPGVGPVTAQKILAWRQQHGSFTSVDQLMEVGGIGEKKLADLAPYATL